MSVKANLTLEKQPLKFMLGAATFLRIRKGERNCFGSVEQLGGKLRVRNPYLLSDKATFTGKVPVPTINLTTGTKEGKYFGQNQPDLALISIEYGSPGPKFPDT